MLIVIPTHFHTTPNHPLEPMVRLLMTDCLFDDGSAVACWATNGEEKQL
jgi:hypothetical protein